MDSIAMSLPAAPRPLMLEARSRYARTARATCLVLACIAIYWAFANSGDLYVRTLISSNQPRYREEIFVVTDAVHEEGDEGPVDSYLTGVVSGHHEILHPQGRLADYPKGTNVRVFYDPYGTSATIQRESLRVLQSTPDFWHVQTKRRFDSLLNVLLALLAAVLLLVVRHFSGRDQAVEDRDGHGDHARDNTTRP
jgi:hypothetical protein